MPPVDCCQDRILALIELGNSWCRCLPAGGRPVVLVWRKRRRQCPDPGCGVKSWTEDSEAVQAWSVLSERARREAVRQVGQDGMSVAAAARGLGISWHTAMKAVCEIGGLMVEAQTGGLRGCCGQGFIQPPARRGPPAGGGSCPGSVAGVSAGGAGRTPRHGGDGGPVPHEKPQVIANSKILQSGAGVEAQPGPASWVGRGKAGAGGVLVRGRWRRWGFGRRGLG